MGWRPRHRVPTGHVRSGHAWVASAPQPRFNTAVSAGYVGILSAELHFPENGSLKGKRKELLSVKAQGRYGPPRSLNLEIAVPLHTELSLSGVNTDVTVDGVQGGISVETVNGQVDVKGGDGFVSLKSVEGEVSLENARGRISVSSVNEGVRVKNANGDISAESVNGEVRLEEITSASVDATTVNGDVIYDGAIQDGGRYSLNTHNGDVTVGAGEKVNATVMVSTFSGEFEALAVIQWKDIVDAMEAAVNTVEDISNVVESIVLKHA